jgi:hypothetical protein
MIHWTWLLLAVYIGGYLEHRHIMYRIRVRHRIQRFRAARRKGLTSREAMSRMRHARPNAD